MLDLKMSEVRVGAPFGDPPKELHPRPSHTLVAMEGY